MTTHANGSILARRRSSCRAAACETGVSSGTFALTVDQLFEEGGVGASTDTEPPLPFTPKLERDPNLDGGKYVVIFNTEDKDSGIDHYEVKDGSGPWVVAESPYVLKDQSVSGDITTPKPRRSPKRLLIGFLA